MKNNSYKFFTLLSAIVFISLFIYVTCFLVIDNSGSFKIKAPIKSKNFSLNQYLSTQDSAHLKEKFPYTIFLSSASWWNEKTINSSLLLLDSLNKSNPQFNEDILITCLCDSLLKNHWGDGDVDSLNALLTLSERYLAFAEVKSERKFLYKTIANTWIDFVSTKISELVKANSSLKYNFKFRYLRERCSEFDATPNFGNSSSEKVFLDFVERKWCYLFIDRYWKGTSIGFKVITIAPSVILFIIFIYGCICIFQKHFKRN